LDSFTVDSKVFMSTVFHIQCTVQGYRQYYKEGGVSEAEEILN